MTTLIIGSTGNTGSAVADTLFKSNHPILLASRSGAIPQRFPASSSSVAGVQFNWGNPSTWENSFSVKGVPPVDRVYLIAPSGVADQVKTAKEFIDLAVDRGVKRLVYLSGSTAKKGDPIPFGQIYEYLDNKGVEYFVLRPTWFTDNLAQVWSRTITARDEIPTASGDGKSWFISAKDIGEAAAEKLSSSSPIRGDARVLGPEAFSYGEVADIISEVVGRKIVKRDLSYEEAVKFWNFGDEVHAKHLAKLEVQTADGVEERFGHEDHIRGKVHLRDWVEANKAIFSSKN